MKLTDKDAGSTIKLKKGDALEIVLRGKPTTGYVWEIAPDSGSLLQAGKWEFKPDGSIPGAGGVYIFGFMVIQQGEAQLKLIYHRTFEADTPPLQTFTVKLVVAES
jgi:inhibitor of cysteine peptidase